MTTVLNAFARDGPHERTNAICAVVARCFGVARELLTEKTSVEDLGMDSIDLLALAVELEEEFDVVILDRALCRILTIGDMIACVAGAVELRRIGRGAALMRQTIDDRPIR